MRTLRGVNYHQAECTAVDLVNKKLTCKEVYTNEKFEQKFDYLIIGCGMRNRTFKTPGLAKENHVFFMKNLWDARRVRNRLLECFERASNPVLP